MRRRVRTGPGGDSPDSCRRWWSLPVEGSEETTVGGWSKCRWVKRETGATGGEGGKGDPKVRRSGKMG